jgi:ribosomal protein S18 acetylase RimI-like enzyme
LNLGGQTTCRDANGPINQASLALGGRDAFFAHHGLMSTKVITYYLEMTNPAELQPTIGNPAGLEVIQAQIPCPELNRFFYTAVGGDWYWIDRLPWTYEQWRAYVARPELETWVAYRAGTPAGYFELEMQPAANVEIVYFGVLPQFIGRGIGGRLLTAAIERAWQRKAARVWLHTCSLDHPGALANYRARGFRLFKEEIAFENLPGETPGPWPGAHRKASLEQTN